MKRSLFVLLLTISISSYCQSNYCQKNTNGRKNSNGLSIKISIPCNWEEVASEVPLSVIKTNYYGKGLVATSEIVIGMLNAETKDSEIALLLSEDGLKTMTQARGEYVSYRKLKVNSLSGAEIVKRTISKTSDGGKFYFYAIQDYFVFNRRIIMVQYTFGAKEESFKMNYNSYKTLFDDLVRKTVFQ